MTEDDIRRIVREEIERARDMPVYRGVGVINKVGPLHEIEPTLPMPTLNPLVSKSSTAMNPEGWPRS